MKKLFKIFINLIILLTISYLAYSQYFGKNKVNYEVFDFQVYETPHFEIYHYIEDEGEIENFAQLCERWYLRHQKIFQDTLEEKNPIIFYKNHPDFQQTTVISSIISVGTGGVTEGYRRRVVMPYSASNAETNHVLGHELVHVFQYKLFKDQRELGLRSVNNVPLWMIEGLAEYLSIGRSDVKTAMWMRDAIMQDDVPTFRDMSRRPNEYFPYRYGHVFWAYMTGLYGDGIIRPLLLTTGRDGYKKALEHFTGYEPDTLSMMWEKAIKQTHSPYLEEKEDSVGEKLFDGSNAGTINIAPSLSPDGENLIFISNKNVIRIGYFLADIDNKEITDRLSNVIRGPDIDAYSFLESAGTWNPNGRQYALTVFSKGKNKIEIVNLEDERVVKKVALGDLEAFNNPDWSPDGDKILVSGLKNGNSDLYVFDIETEELEQLTDDKYSDMQPSWSPDGSKIVFISDRTRKTDFQQVQYGNFRMTIYDLNTDKISTVDILQGADIINPKYSPDGKEIYFVSNADGFRNIYRYNIENDITRKVTDLKTGVSGISELSPCFDISDKSEELVYVLYSNDGYQLYSQKLSEFEGPVFSSHNVDLEPATIISPEKETGAPMFVDENLRKYPTTDSSRFTFQPYHPEFGLETIGSPGIGVGASRYGTGMAGGVSFLFSDILKRNILMTALQMQGRIYDIAGQVYYLNQRTQFNWGASFSHTPYRSSGSFLRRDSLGQTPVQNLVLIEQRTFEDELGILGQYPLSKKLRFETGVTASMYSFRIDSINNYFYRGRRVSRESHKLDAPESFFIYRSYVAYVGDGSRFGLTSPMSGYRYRFQVDRTFGEVGYWGLLADYRKYFFFPPVGLGFRIMHYGRYGRSADELYPNFIGQEYYIRGYSYRSMSRNQCASDNCLSVNNLVGSKMVVANAEFRLPLTGPKRLAMIKSRMFFTDLVAFVDGGLAWSDADNVKFQWKPPAEANTKIPVFSAGLAVRLNLFGAIILEPYYAFPFQRPEMKSSGTLGLHLSAGGF